MFAKKKLVLVITLVALVGLLSASVALANPPLRTIKLESQGSGGGGTVSLMYQPNSGTKVVQWAVQGIPSFWGGDAWSLYLTTPSIGRVRIATFNVTGGFGSHSQFSSYAFLQDPTNPAWFEESITAEIYQEKDDGMDAPDAGALPILVGSD